MKDFCVSGKNLIYMLDDEQNAILVYDNNASFKKKISLDNHYYNRIASSGENILLSTRKIPRDASSTLDRLILMNPDGKVIKRLYSSSPGDESAPWRGADLGIDITSNHHLIYYPHFSNHVYILDSLGEIKQNYIYKAEGYEMPPYLTLALRKRESFSEAFEKCRKYSKSSIMDVIEVDNYICTTLDVGPCIVITFYNKRDKSNKVMNFIKCKTWQDIFARSITFAGGMPDDTLIAWLSVSVLKIAQEVAQKENVDMGKYGEIISNMNEEDNPYLLLVKIK